MREKRVKWHSARESNQNYLPQMLPHHQQWNRQRVDQGNRAE